MSSSMGDYYTFFSLAKNVGKQPGKWVFLGIVEISNKNTDGYVIADAVQLLPVGDE